MRARDYQRRVRSTSDNRLESACATGLLSRAPRSLVMLCDFRPHPCTRRSQRTGQMTTLRGTLSMSTSTSPRRWLGVAAVLLCLGPLSAAAQEYPNRTIRVVVPYSAGGASDVPMRVI